jgi:hypothetical protein
MDELPHPHVYRRFRALWADSEPLRSPRELAAAMRAAGIAPAQITDDWLRALSSAWVYGESDEPFADEGQNRSYRRELGH